jgi:hypothetical protein
MRAKWELIMMTALGCSTAMAGATAMAAGIGLPAGAFPVEYINGAGNSLVIVPVHETSLIFANVSSGSGARYAAGQYIWWEAGGAVTFYSDSLAGKTQSACHRAGVQ